MKRLLITILALALLLSASGQILRYSNYNSPTPPAPPTDYYDEYDTIYAAFDTAPHDTIADLQEALVYSLDTMDFAGGASVWDRMAVFYVFAAHLEADESMINWADPGTYDADNPTATVWTQWEGYTGNGLGDGDEDYISTNFTQSLDSIIAQRNSTSIGIYVRNNLQQTASIYGGGTTTSMILLNTTNTTITSINSSNTQTESDQTDSRGLWISTRRNSSGTTSTELYRNGTSIDTEDNASTFLSASEIFILKRNGGTTSTTYQVSIFFMMNAVSDEEVTAINTVIETYMDALGKGVQ